jgi:hypothetical protein
MPIKQRRRHWIGAAGDAQRLTRQTAPSRTVTKPRRQPAATSSNCSGSGSGSSALHVSVAPHCREAASAPVSGVHNPGDKQQGGGLQLASCLLAAYIPSHLQ